MRLRFLKTAAALVCTLVLAACAADELQIDISQTQIEDAIALERPMLDFVAEFSGSGELSDSERADFKKIEAVLREYMTITDFVLDVGVEDYTLTVEGRMPLTSQAEDKSPWFVSVRPYPNFEGAYLVQLETSEMFGELEDDIQDISFSLSPDRIHPTKFRLSAEALRVVAPAAAVGGDYALFQDRIVTDRLNLQYTGGAYSEIGAGFLVFLP